MHADILFVLVATGKPSVELSCPISLRYHAQVVFPVY